MKIITSHERTDMDGLASMYAASLLYPDYQVILPQKLNRNLRDFLALYRDELLIIDRGWPARRSISDLILVDTQAVASMKGMSPATRIQIFDHHQPKEAVEGSAPPEGQALGATTTLLVEQIQGREISLSPLGATLLLLGIYEDTGSLSYGTTTTRDALAVAWLLGQGADLTVADRFLRHPLSARQREALSKLISSAAIHTVRGRSICLTAIALPQYIDELSSLVHPIMDVYEPDACLLLAEHGGSVQIIGRSSVDAVDVARLLRGFGGGGHSRAAAALVDDTTLSELTVALLAALEEQTDPPVLVREIMSTNVHTLGPSMSIRDAAQLMRRYGHEGFPVVDRDRLIGILVRSDVDRALHHRLGDMPVSSILHTGPLHVLSHDPVSEVQRVMIEHSLGQVPVVEEGRFLGIVTRTDLIKLWTPTSHQSRAADLRRMMTETLPEGLQELLYRARDAANDLGYSLYIVGGFVRDLLLESPTLDLDLVVEGDAIRMAKRLASQVGARVRSHARFGTAKVILKGERPEGVPPSLDFVTARTEFYERPTVLPEVERSSIKQDLYRRDFTINTMAICLDRDRFGELLDYYGGERDLHAKNIRVLHNLSFVEDPTRILRAVRFEQRLGFEIEERTAELIDDASELLESVTGERLAHELYLILNEKEPERILDRLARTGVLGHIHPNLRFSRGQFDLFMRIRERIHQWPARDTEGPVVGESSRSERIPPLVDKDTDSPEESPPPSVSQENGAELSLCYLALLTSSLERSSLESFATHLRIGSDNVRFLNEVMRLRDLLDPLGATVMLPSAIYRLLHPFSREARFVLSVLSNAELILQRLSLYEKKLSAMALHVDGHYLRSLGVPPGPIYGEILNRLQEAILDGQVNSEEGEQALARHLVRASHGLTTRRTRRSA